MIEELQRLLDENPLKAIERAREIIDSSEKIKDAKTSLHSQLILNTALVRTGQYPAAQKEFPLFIRKLKNNNLVSLELQALEEFAGLMLLFNDKKETLDQWLRCFLLAVEHENIEYAIKSLCGIGKAFWSDSDYSNAKTFHLQAVEFANLYPRPSLVTYANLSLAVDYISTADYQLCLDILGEHKDVILSQDNDYWKAEFYLYLSESQLHSNSLKEGENNLRKARTLAERLNFWRLLVPIYRNLHSYLLKINNVDGAEEAIEKAIAAAELTESDKYQEEICLLASAFFEARGDFKAAHRYMKKANNHTEALLLRVPPSSTRKINKSVNKALKKVAEARLQIINARISDNLQESRDLIESLEHKSYYDSLTKNYNRLAFEEKFKEISLSPSEQLIVVIMDIDHFKSVNDTFGHDKGDETLASFGDILLGSCLPENQ